jgi:hypothetical protein
MINQKVQVPLNVYFMIDYSSIFFHVISKQFFACST